MNSIENTKKLIKDTSAIVAALVNQGKPPKEVISAVALRKKVARMVDGNVDEAVSTLILCRVLGKYLKIEG